MSGIFDQIINYSPPLIVSGTVNYKGTWNASTNNPTLNSSPAASTKGDYYVVSTAGTQFGITFAIGDWIISNGTAWEKVDLTDAVSSVFGRTGAVVGVSTDYSAVGLTNTAIGAANPSSGAFTSLSSSSTTTLNGTTVPASKTLVVTTDKLSALASTTSSELAGVISDETGSGALVFGTSPTIATPVIAQINDANGNATLRLTGITSATDYLEIKNGIGVGSPLHVLAEGASTNIGVHLQPKGSGLFTISDGTDFNKGIRFRSSSSAASAVTLIDAVSTAGRVITLPDATGTLLYGGGPLGTPSSGTVTNLTGTASININGTVGATTPSTGAFTTLSASTSATVRSGATGLVIRDYTAGSLVSLYSTNVTASDTNYSLSFDGVNTYLNGATSARLVAAGTTVASATSTGLAVTGALSATGNTITFGTDNFTLTDTYFGYVGNSYRVLRVGTNATQRSVALCVDPSTITGSNFSGTGQILIANNSVLAPDSAGTNWMGVIRATGGNVVIGPVLTGGEIVGGVTGTMTMSSTGLAVTGALSSTTGATFATSSGNVGIGVTPSAWAAGSAAMQNSAGSIWRFGTTNIYLGQNYYYDGSNRVYSSSDAATEYQQGGGTHRWFTAASGTAGNAITFTQAMTLDTSGFLQLATTTSSGKILTIGSASASISLAGTNGGIYFGDAGSPTGSGGFGVNCAIARSGGAGFHIGGSVAGDFCIAAEASKSILFGTSASGNSVERARIDSSGNLLVGTTSTFSTWKLSVDSGSNDAIGGIANNVSSFPFIAWNKATSGDNVFAGFFTEGTITQRGSISYNRAAGLVVYGTTSDYRSKDILGPVVDSGALIDSVPVYMGKMKGATQERPMFIAHETPAYAHTGEKDAVDAEGNPVYQQIDNSTLIPVLWAEIQSLRQRVVALESK